MAHIQQLNFGAAHDNSDDALPHAVCNCLLIDDGETCTLIDSGFGTLEIDTLCMLAEKLPELYDIPINPSLPAARQLPLLGYETHEVTDIVLTHLDLDHAGGLKDFPSARVHLSREEFEARNDFRYLQDQFKHDPSWRPAERSTESWFGLAARSLPISSKIEILLVPLPGHTVGHCGVAIRRGSGKPNWIFHVGDAYYDHEELELSYSERDASFQFGASDSKMYRQSLSILRRLLLNHRGEIKIISSHDASEHIPQDSHLPHNHRVSLAPLRFVS
jgi:glyoxylase-like metal-dependent hydrolase (beta-lactamase superfamily II)